MSNLKKIFLEQGIKATFNYQLIIGNKIKIRIRNWNPAHWLKLLLREEDDWITLLIISRYKVGNIIFFHSYFWNNWLKIQFTNPKKKFSQAFLHFLIFRLLVSDNITYCSVITKKLASFPRPIMTPNSNCNYHANKFFNMYGNIKARQFEGKFSTKVLV